MIRAEEANETTTEYHFTCSTMKSAMSLTRQPSPNAAIDFANNDPGPLNLDQVFAVQQGVDRAVA